MLPLPKGIIRSSKLDHYNGSPSPSSPPLKGGERTLRRLKPAATPIELKGH